MSEKTEAEALGECISAIERFDTKTQKRIAAYLTGYAEDRDSPAKVGFANHAAPQPQEPSR